MGTDERVSDSYHQRPDESPDCVLPLFDQLGGGHGYDCK